MFSAIKLSLNNEVRRLTIFESTLTYQTLLETSHRLFPVLKNSSSEISFAWIDDEGDIIVLSSDEELSEAMRIMESQNKSSIRFEIILSDTDSRDSKEEIPGENAVHSHVTCDECGVHPIVGVRYKCAIRNDYDLCATCESKRAQPHAMVKIYSPQQAPKAIYIAVNDEDIPPSPPHVPHAEEIIHDMRDGSWHRPNRPHSGPRFGPHQGPQNSQPPHGHPNGPPFGHGPHGHAKPWRGRGGRCGRGRCGMRQDNWRKFVDEAVSSATDIATTVADLAQVHIADIAGALNKQTNNATTTTTSTRTNTTTSPATRNEVDADEEEIMMNIAVAESLSNSHSIGNMDVDASCAADREGEEFKESDATESEPAHAAAPMSVDAALSVESASEWELVGRSSPSTSINNATAAIPAPTPVPVSVAPSSAPAFAHGFIAPAVERPGMQGEASAVPVSISAAAAAFPTGQTQTLSGSEVEEWRSELLLLANMGFDNVLEVLPLLRKFCSPPVSQQPVGAQPSAEGVQRVVHHLLAN